MPPHIPISAAGMRSEYKYTIFHTKCTLRTRRQHESGSGADKTDRGVAYGPKYAVKMEIRKVFVVVFSIFAGRRFPEMPGRQTHYRAKCAKQ